MNERTKGGCSPVQQSSLPCHGLWRSTSSNPPTFLHDITEYRRFGRKKASLGGTKGEGEATVKGDEVEKPDRDNIPKLEEEASDMSSSSGGCSTLQQEVVAMIWMVMVMVTGI